MSIELVKSEKIAINEMELKRVKGTIYNLVIQKRVADMVDDKDTAANCIKQLEKFEKMKDAYEAIIKEETNKPE